MRGNLSRGLAAGGSLMQKMQRKNKQSQQLTLLCADIIPVMKEISVKNDESGQRT